MIVRFEFDHPTIGLYGIELPPYQWNYTDGFDALTREIGTTAAGVHEQAMLNIVRRFREMRFVGTDDLLELLQIFSVMVHRFSRDVTFFPDFEDDPGTSWELDWENEVSFSQVEDDRKEIILRVVEKSPGGEGD